MTANGSEISELSYDSVLIFLEVHFGQKDIINHHMNAHLQANEIQKLNSDNEINVRSLSAIGFKPINYGPMLIVVILKLIIAG